MPSKEYSWQAADGVTISAQEWKPETPARGVVVLIHGLGEHAGRYAHVAAAMNAAGYAVLAPDLRGHGNSGGKRGHFSSYDTVADDIQCAFKEATTRYPGIPQFLYGHSLGGALVLYYVLKRKPSIRGVIATSPGLAPGSPLPVVKLAAAKLLNVVGPTLTLDNGLDLGNLSHDPAVRADYVADPKTHPLVSARLGMQLIQQGAWIQAQKGEFPIPLLLLQGTADHLVNLAATRAFASGQTGDVTYKEWDGWYHELHNELGKAEVIQVMVDWLKAHT
jgi:alpha-beta hydrolase superfamily lysophospholipase